jgi:O-antigen/teichoic acid export membrane protein
MTGTTIAQAIPIAISPILTRLYTPEDFGVFALYISISSMVSIVATGKYELAIILPNKESDAINIIILSIIISLLVSFVCFFIVFLFNYQITTYLGNEELGIWLYFIPIVIFFTGVYQSFNYWNNRKKQYQRIAHSKILQSITGSSTNLGMGFSGFGSSGLIFGSILGQIISAGMLAKFFWKEDSHKLNKLRIVKLIALSKRYIDFPKINMPHSLFNMLQNFVVNIFLIKYYNTFLLGQFYMVNKILLLPSSLISSSISQVLFAEISKMYNKKQDFSNIILKTIVKLFILSLPPFFIIIFFSEEIFIFIFGEKWAVAGNIAAALSPVVLLQFIASPTSIVPIVVKKQQKAFYINMFGMGLYVGSIVIGYFIFNDLIKSLLMLSFFMSMYYIFLLSWLYKISKVYLK